MATFYPGQTDYVNALNVLAAGGLVPVVGTFTPSLAGATTAGTGTYTARSGYFTKLSNRVYFQLSITVSAHTGTGPMILNNLPYPASNNVNVPVHAYITDTSFSGALTGGSQVVANSSSVTIPSLNLASALMATPFTLLVSGEYMTDS